jgi:alkylation response protein AidB-like acyl-CoA dehydrogenase
MNERSMNSIDWQQCLRTLGEHARTADENAIWPVASWQALAQAGVLEWSIGREAGSASLDVISLLQRHEELASACLTTTFILSQREAAVRRIAASTNEPLRGELLPPLARGERFATVGLSQLTTSRQHLQPSLVAQATNDGFVVDGSIPWVTGAAKADHIVIGAVIDSGEQILIALPRDLPGVIVEPPLDLMALQGSLTAELRLDHVQVARRWLLAGPAKQVLTTGRSGPGGLETSCLALGLAGAAIDHCAREAAVRTDLCETADNLEQDRHRVRREMHRLALAGSTAESAAALRTQANSLVLRATQAALTVSKGTGFLRSHPAQRWARQALFFLVWSCPRPTTEATLAQLAPPAGECL